MENSEVQGRLSKLEEKTLIVGLILSGIAIIFTAASYVVSITFSAMWLVWLVGLVFAAVGFSVLESVGGFENVSKLPEGNHRKILIYSIPASFILSSQTCGLGLQACSIACHVINILLILIALFIAYRIQKGQKAGIILAPLVVIAMIPHCICNTPINSLWHSLFNGVSPVCELLPLTASLLAISALHGIRPRSKSTLAAIIFVLMLLIIVGGLMFGFPWQGCVDHPM